MSYNRILDVGLSGLFSASAGLQTSSHNIANVGTEGFSRQAVTTGTRNALALSYGVLGGGTDVTSVRRMTDDFLLGRMREESSQLSVQIESQNALRDVELMLGSVDENNIGTAIDAFFASWNGLSAPPITSELRLDVLNKADMLASRLNDAAKGLQDQAAQIDNQLESSVATLNGLLATVADLNQQIMIAEGPGETANDLRDRRDLVLQDIAGLASVDVVDRGDGTVDVIMAGRSVVVRDTAQELEMIADDDGVYQLASGVRGYVVDLQGGSIAGMIEARREDVLGTLDDLDAFAAELADRVNDLHTQGRTAGGSGLMFFTGTGAADLAVNERLVDDPNLVATSRSGLAGDADLARAIAALGDDAPAGSSVKGLSEMFGELIVKVASDTASTNMAVESQQQTVDTLDTRLESLRGVSLDEEAANMARYQNAYAASAQVIATAQDMFDTVLSML